jgi:hypothetical protein
LDPTKWPDDISSPWIEGEQKLRELCAQFRVSFENAQNGFRNFIDDGGVRVTAGLAELDSLLLSKHYQFLQQMLNEGSVR